jgi:hypothetical protein
MDGDIRVEYVAAVFVDQAAGVSLPSDVVPAEIDRFG